MQESDDLVHERISHRLNIHRHEDLTLGKPSRRVQNQSRGAIVEQCRDMGKIALLRWPCAFSTAALSFQNLRGDDSDGCRCEVWLDRVKRGFSFWCGGEGYIFVSRTLLLVVWVNAPTRR